MPETVSACTRYTRVYGVRMATTERQHDLACMPWLSYHSCIAGLNKTEIIDFDHSVYLWWGNNFEALEEDASLGGLKRKRYILRFQQYSFFVFHIWNKLPWKTGAHDHSINQSFCELLPCNAKELSLTFNLCHLLIYSWFPLFLPVVGHRWLCGDGSVMSDGRDLLVLKI